MDRSTSGCTNIELPEAQLVDESRTENTRGRAVRDRSGGFPRRLGPPGGNGGPFAQSIIAPGRGNRRPALSTIRGAPVTSRLVGLSLAELPLDTLVRAEDVARFIGCSPRTIQRAGIPCVTVTPRVRRYRVRDIREWIDAHVRRSA